MKYKLGQWLIGCFVTMVSLTTGAWSQPIEQLTINYIEVLSIPDQCTNQVHVYATVSDAVDSSILGLPAAAFKSIEDGREIDIDAVSKAIDPMSIVLAIDSSGSMQARDKSGLTSMEAAKNAAADFISMLAQNDRVAVYSFNNEPVLLMDFSNDHQAAINTVKGLFAKQNAATCLYDTAYAAVKKAAEIPRGRRAIVLLTDGKDEKAGRACSTHPVNDVIDIATTKTIRVPIYTIGVGPQVDARELGRMAGLTGGRSLLATSPVELQKFYQIIADQLKNQYLVKYFTRTASGEHSLVLKIEHEGRQVQDEKRFFSPPLPVLHSRRLSVL